MRLLFWGKEINRLRCEFFLKKAKEQGFIINYSHQYKRCTNKVINEIYETLNIIKDSFFLGKIDVVYIPPMEYRISKILLAKLFRCYIICDIYAPHFDMTVNDGKKYKAKSIIGKLYYLRDRVSMLMSDLILFLNEPERDYYLSTVNLCQTDVNSFILPLVKTEKKPAQLKYFKNKRGILHLFWTGSFIALQGLEVIIDAIEILNKTSMQFKLFIIGPNNEKNTYWQDYIKQKGLQEVVEFPQVWGDLSAWETLVCEECDINLGIFGNSDKAHTVVANKVIDGITARTPVITGPSKGINHYFNGNDIFICNNDSRSLSNLITSISKMSYEQIKSYIDNAFGVYLREFSVQEYLKKVSLILSMVHD